MATVLMFAPLLAAHLFTMGQAREVRGHGLVVRAVAREHRGATDATIEIRRGHEAPQIIELRGREIGPALLLASIEIFDANFDGVADVPVLREHGAKWASVDAFLFDARTHRFADSSPLARAIGGLANARFDARHRSITTRDLGPSNPSRVTYAVEGAALHEISSCRFLNPFDARVGTLVRKNAGRVTVTKLRLAETDVSPCH